MKVDGGYTTYGQEVGILMLETVFPRLPGDIGNAYTFKFPVRYKLIRGAQPERIILDEPDPLLLEPFIEGARELEKEGVKAITTSCGFLAPFQKELASAVNIPVFTSSLVLVPMVRTMLKPDREIAVFTINPRRLNEKHFRGAGWSGKEIPVVIAGMKEEALFPQVYFGNKTRVDPGIIREEFAEMTRQVIKEHPRLGAIILECTNMAPFSRWIHEVSGLPVFSINSLVEFVYQAVRPSNYSQP